MFLHIIQSVNVAHRAQSYIPTENVFWVWKTSNMRKSETKSYEPGRCFIEVSPGYHAHMYPEYK